MKKAVLLLFGLWIADTVFSQEKRDYTWVLGSDNHHIDPDGVELRFDDSSFSKFTYHSICNMVTQSAVISDTEGRLLFYSDGCRIANADHEIMASGDSINYPGFNFERNCVSSISGYLMMHGLTALPWPGREGIYVLFHLHVSDPHREWPPDQVLYSVIDMREEGGKGRVVAKNQLLWRGPVADCMTAVRHGNGRDWWIVTSRSDSTKVYNLFLLSPEGIGAPQTQEIGYHNMGRSQSQAVFSPDGTLYARTQWNGTTLLMDFDRCSGRFSCPRRIEIYNGASGSASGAAFSPSSRFLYISVPLYLYQYDTWSANPNQKPVLIDTYDGFENPFSTTFHRQMLAPDGKIYMSATNGVYNLHVIESPDLPGTACNFRQHGINLPASGFFNLPNFPVFRLYDLPHSVCDSLGIDAPPGRPQATWTPPEGVTVLPNPVRDEAYIALASCASGDLRIFDAAGRLMYEERDWQGPRTLRLDVGHWPNGVYFVNVHYYKKYQYNVKMVVWR